MPSFLDSFLSPQSVGGLGLLGASMLGREEPGYVTEARQFLRNRYTSPEALPGEFTGLLPSLEAQFDPFFKQQEQRGIADISQRFANAFPGEVGAQGPEFGALGRYLTDEMIPGRQSFYGNTALNLLNAKERAASQILEMARPDALSLSLIHI